MKTFITFILSLLLFWGCSSSEKPNWTAFTVATGNVSRSTIAIDTTTGTIYVAWVGTKESVSNVYLARLRPGKSEFSKPVRVNHAKGQAGSHSQAPPQVAVSPTGIVYVTWTVPTKVEGRIWPVSDIFVARSENGGRTFAPGVNVAVNQPSYPTGQNFHDIAIGPNGTVYISWLDSRAGDGPVQSSSHHSRSSAGHHMHGPHMSGHNMNSMPMHHQAGTQVRVARSTNHAKSFAPGKIVARHTCQCCRTAITVGNNGTVYLAWRHIFGNSIRDMAIARSTDKGKSFTAPVRIHKDGWKIRACPHAGPSIVVNDKGQVFAFWYTGARGKAGIYMAKTEGKGLDFGKAISLPGGIATSQVEADVNANGDVWFAWANYSESIIKIGNYIDGNLQKSFATIKQARLPSIAVTNKYMAVTWLATDTIKVRVYKL